GIVDFGDRYKSAAMYNHYASVAARSMTIDNSAATAKTVAVGAGMPSSLTPTITFTAGYASCAPLADGTYGNVFVTIRNPAKATLTRFFGATYSVTGTAVARCNGS
ncbi:MAG: hypothetical protein JWQ70_2963, partial [Aeromicrobium sp.]|nr:hypothetical protein [Aeromicrobium sp.]